MAVNDEVSLGIGQMSEENGVSVRMLRYYHEKGVLVPARVNESTGYRSYTPEQLPVLDMIQQMQALEIPLETIKQIIDRHDVDYAIEVLADRRAQISEKLNELKIEEQVCDALLQDYRLFLNKPVCDQIMLEMMPERRCIRFKDPNARAYTPAITNSEADRLLEDSLRLVKRRLIDGGYPMALFRNVGCMIPYEHLVKREFVFEYMYVFAYGDLAGYSGTVETIPSGQYVSVFSSGQFYPDGRYKTLDDINRLLDYIDGHGMVVAGDYIDEIIAETPPFADRRHDMLFKLSIPVRQQ